MDPRDDQFKLIEVNARFWKWHSLSTACGSNVAYATYCDAIGRPLEPQAARDEHRVWAMSMDDLVMTGSRVWRRDYSWRRWWKAYKFPWVDGIFSWRDPLPGFLFIWNRLRIGLSRLRRHRSGGQDQPAPALGTAVGITEATARAGSDYAHNEEAHE